MLGFKWEPVAIAAAVRAIILAFMAFGLDWTAEQVAAIMLAIEAVFAVFTRNVVTSDATLEKAGLTRRSVARTAELNETKKEE